MSFASLIFGVFFPIVLIVMSLTNLKTFAKTQQRRAKTRDFRLLLLLAASYVFCGWFDWRFCLVLFGVTLVSHFCALNIQQGRAATFNLRIGIIVPIVALAFFKYYNFFLDSVASLLSTDVGSLGTIKIILPIGVSFYSFQAISYVVDVHRRKLEASRSFVKTALYMAFFPRLVAGPIVKASFFLPQLEEERNVNLKNLEIGVQIFLIGLFKKIVVADRLAPFVDQVYDAPACFHGFTVCLAVVSYSLQIYFDFAGYSDMAIGAAKMLGYDLPRNFNFPYLSRNPSEFWKRWHISLSSWLMEYLYIPFGGNRKGKFRTYINLLLTMLIGGLWHGANWAFVAWGGFHGLALCVHKFFKTLFSPSTKALDAARASQERSSGLGKTLLRFIGWSISVVGTFIWVSWCWIPFKTNDFIQAQEVFCRMFVWNDGVFFVYVWTPIYAALLSIVSVIALIRYRQRLKQIEREGTEEELKRFLKVGVEMNYPILDLSKISRLAILCFFIYVIISFAYFGYHPFVYLQF